jgi:hypothetical protein
MKHINAAMPPTPQLLIYRSRRLGNGLGQATGTELPMRNIESFVNIGQRLR